MPKIVIKNMSFEKALRIFRKKVEKSELKDDLRKKEYYEKPNWKRRRKLKSAIKRNERELAKEQAYWNDYRRVIRGKK